MSTNTYRALRATPLAAALLIGIGLLAGCNRHEETAENAAKPPAAMTPPVAASTTMPTSATTAMATPAGMPPPEASATGSSGPITDTSFYQQALAAGEKEIAAAKLAEKNATAKVKAFAKMLVADHTALGKKVKDAAGSAVTEPATPPDTSALEGKTGQEFDKAFVDQMVTDHQDAVALFDNASKNASTDKAKQIATDALPKLQKHLDEAQKLQASLQQ